MSALNKKKQNDLSHHKNGEIRLSGRAVSRGVGVGRILSLFGQKRQFYRIKLENSKIEAEIRRFRAAVRLAKRQIKKISEQKSGKSQTGIFETHLLFLEDASLLSKIEDFIKRQKVNAEWAVKIVTDGYIADYKAISDENLRDRYIDLEDIAERLLTALGGGGKANIRLEKDTIIVAKEVKPSTLIELVQSKPKAIITENGGWTSHTFILARELNLPAVTGMKGILRRVQSGENVVVDGFSGQVILHPKVETLRQYKKRATQIRVENPTKEDLRHEEIKTLDGQKIIIRANLDFTKDYAEAKRLGAKGIGLYRSEFLFNQNKGFPTEKEQIEIYRKIAKIVGDDRIRIRTFDLSVEQLAGEMREREKNPALGLRAIRLSLAQEKQFRTQLRALLRASWENKLDIVLPMVSDVSEILRAREILEQEKEKLAKRKIKFGEMRLGAMIEVPSAVFLAEQIACEVDFLNLGTNDLVQYLLAVDRDNEAVSDWFRTLHPSVLRAVKTVLQAGEKCEKPVIICGEMAGSSVYAAILIGLGATELSMNVHSIARVRKTIANIAFEEAREIVKELETCRTAAEVEEKVRSSFLEKWSHLFGIENLPV
ncbi:MAG TPA: phosphoenolpyruvate--protein phosphotransferase [Pyrinomonadaceae bacterium]|nr:phosphoenolpyruvate--protein phosphotransferase [Pyrinomonadaceae bacterium]